MKKIVLILTLALCASQLTAQRGVGTATPNTDAVMHLVSSDSAKGLIIPIVSTAKRPAASAALNGMIVYNITDSCVQVCDGATWDCLSTDTTADKSEWTDQGLYILAKRAASSGDTVIITDNGDVGIGTSTPLAALEVVGSGLPMARFRTSNSSLESYIAHGSASVNFASDSLANNAFAINPFKKSVQLYTNGSLRYVMDSNGIARYHDYGVGNHEVGDISGKVLSNYVSAYATDGTVVEVHKDSLGHRLQMYTVATLPAGAAAKQGDIAYVTDAASPNYLAPVVGGGSVVTPVFYNGTAWVCH